MRDLGERLLEAVQEDGVDPDRAADVVLGYDTAEDNE